MDRRRSRLVTLAVTLCVTVLTMTAALISHGDKERHQTVNPIVSGAPGEAVGEPGPVGEENKVTHKYIVRQHNGFVTVFTFDNQDTPLMVTDTPVAVLPSHDRARLEEGIMLSTDEELAMLLEDLSS